MADTTNQEFIDKIAALPNPQENKEAYDTSLIALLNELNGRTSLDGLDAATLDKFIELVDGRNLPENLRSLPERIINRRRELTAQTEGKTATPEATVQETNNTTAQAQPEATVQETGTAEQAQPEPENTATPQPQENKKSEFDGMPSYDLLQTYHQLKRNAAEYANVSLTMGDAAGVSTNPEDVAIRARFNKVMGQMKDIEEYVKAELEKTVLSASNAPMVEDYTQIMALANPEYKYDKADELEQKLAEYDQINGLDGEIPSAEQAVANKAKWKELIKDTNTEELVDIPAIQILKDADKQTADDLIEILKTTALTQLMTKEPSENPQEAMQAYKDALNKVGAQYMANLEEAAKKFPLSIDEDYLTNKFMRDFQIPKEQFDAIMQDEEKKKHMEAGLKEYIEAQKILYNNNLKDYLRVNNLTQEDWDNADANSPIRKGFEKYNIVTPAKAMNAVYTQGNTVYASRLARKAQMARTPSEAAALQQNMTKKNSAFMGMAGAFLKNAGTTMAIGAVFGTVGLTVKQGWDLYKDFKKSWKKFTEQTNGKTSKWSIKDWKNFRNYLRENPDERMNLKQKTVAFAVSLTASAAIVSAVGLTGGLGLAGGAVAGLTGAAAQNAATATTQILGQNIAITKLKGIASGAVAAGFGAARYINARKEARPLERELLAILSRQEGLNNQPQKKGFFARFTSKDPAKKTMNDLTSLMFNGEDKMAAKVAQLPLSAQDKERVMELAIQLKAIKGKAYAAGAGAMAGAAGGLFVAEDGAQKIAGMFGGAPAPETDTPIDSLAEGAKVGAGVGEAVEAETTPENAGETVVPVPEVQMETLNAAEFERGGDMWYITMRGPTVVYEDFEKNGWLTSEEIETLKGGKKYITSDDLSKYLESKQYTPEQLQEIRDYASKSNRDYFETRVKEVNDRDGWHDPSTVRSGTGNTGGGNAGSEAAQSDDDVPAPIKKVEAPEKAEVTKPDTNPDNSHIGKAIEEQKTMRKVSGKAETGGWFKRMFTKKHDYDATFKSNGDLNKDVENYAARVAMQSKGMPINPDSHSALKQDGYTVSGSMVDAKGESHDFKVKVKGKDDYTIVNRTVDDVRSKAYVLENGTKVEYLKGQKEAASFVGDANGTKADEVLGSIRHANGTSVTYIRDGDTKDIYMKSSDGEGNDLLSKTTFSKRDVMKIMKENRTRR